MKATLIASSGAHVAVALVLEYPQILATRPSQLAHPIGHGVTWKTGAAYIQLRDGSRVVCPRRVVAAQLRRLGNRVVRWQ